VLALAVAQERPDLVDRVVLANPATSFQRSPWPMLGPLLPRVPKVGPGCPPARPLAKMSTTVHASQNTYRSIWYQKLHRVCMGRFSSLHLDLCSCSPRICEVFVLSVAWRVDAKLLNIIMY
jgi:pimeloyl-ACP methyl ester carboxylesterase